MVRGRAQDAEPNDDKPIRGNCAGLPGYLPVTVWLTFYWASGIQTGKALTKKLGSQFVEEVN